MKSFLKRGFVAFAFAALVLAANRPANAAPYSYTLTDLGSLSRALYTTDTVYKPQMPENRAFGINDSGTVVGELKGQFNIGTVTTPSWKSQTHVIMWTNVGGSGQVQTNDIGMFGSAGTYPTYKALANGINSTNQMTGFYTYKASSSGGNVQVASIFNSDKSYATISNPAGYMMSVGNAINNNGVVVGYSTKTSGTSDAATAFIYDQTNGSRVIPGATVGTVVNNVVQQSKATAINNSGLVTGFSYSSAAANNRAFIYDPSTATPFSYIGTLGGSTSYGTGINDSGAVVGYSNLLSGVQHGFLYTNGNMTDLGALGGVGNTSQANAINNKGVIVGTSNNLAFVYENNQMFDLNTLIGPASSGFLLTNATGINNLGQIVGYGNLITGKNTDGSLILGEERAFAVTPTPIPPAVFLFGSGLSGMFFLRRRKTAA